MFVVVPAFGHAHEVYGPFTNLDAAIAWHDVNGGIIRPLKSPTPIPDRVKLAATVVTVGV